MATKKIAGPIAGPILSENPAVYICGQCDAPCVTCAGCTGEVCGSCLGFRPCPKCSSPICVECRGEGVTCGECGTFVY